MRSYVVFLVFALTAPVLRAQSPTLEPLGDLPGGEVYGAATAISADGSIVVGASSSENGLEAFRWENGVMEGLGDLPGGPFSSVALDVSADGSVVVGVSYTPDDRPEAFRWENGVMEGLGNLPGASYSYAYGVSADGSVIVGECGMGSDTIACRWVDGGPPESLGDLPGGNEISSARGVTADGSAIVGQCLTAEGYVGCRWVDGGPPEGVGATTSAQAIAPNGAVTVGYCSLVPEVPCRWMDGGPPEDLGVLPGTTAYLGAATATTDDGALTLGWMFSASFDYYGLLWIDGGEAREAGEALEDVFDVDLGSWTDLRTGGSIGSGLDIIHGIGGVTGDGRVLVGAGTNPDGDLAAWRLVLPQGTPVEPDAPDAALALSVASSNPFLTRLLLALDVPEVGAVTVAAYDALGRRVAVLHDGPLAVGTHTLRFDAADLPSGMYAVRASGPSGTVSRRVTLLR